MTPGICDRNFQAVDSDSDAYRPPSIGIKPNPSEYRYVLAPQGVASDCASRNDPGRDRNLQESPAHPLENRLVCELDCKMLVDHPSARSRKRT